MSYTPVLSVPAHQDVGGFVADEWSLVMSRFHDWHQVNV